MYPKRNWCWLMTWINDWSNDRWSWLYCVELMNYPNEGNKRPFTSHWCNHWQGILMSRMTDQETVSLSVHCSCTGRQIKIQAESIWIPENPLPMLSVVPTLGFSGLIREHPKIQYKVSGKIIEEMYHSCNPECQIQHQEGFVSHKGQLINGWYSH